jgi:uncharacterized protein YjcR
MEAGRHARGVTNGRAKLNEQQVREIRALFASGVRGVDISRMYGLSAQQVSRLKHGERWKHLQ